MRALRGRRLSRIRYKLGVESAPKRSPRRRRWWIALYLVALGASQAWIATRERAPEPAPAGSLRVRLGPPPAGLGALSWPAIPQPGERLPLLLLHGSPGDASNFAALGPRLSRGGRELLALDLPGFGASVSVPGSRSIEAHARAALAACPWPKFHVLAWSMGGGVALHMAQQAPERVRSLSLVASIGVQEAEGSGSFAFEHLKYALNGVIVVALPECIPHFGALGARESRLGFCLNFWQSDQRPLRGLLQGLQAPTLIAHGREDFLVPLWCAEQSHALVEHSRLVVFDAGHFLVIPPPLGQLDRLAPEVEGFLARHDRPGTLEPRARVEHPVERPRATPEPYALARSLPWWIALLACALLGLASPLGCGLLVGALSALLQLDLGLGLIGAALGASPRPLLRRSPQEIARALGACLLGALLGALFAALAGETLCRALGAWGGTAASLALPLLAVVGLARALRGWRRSRSRPRPRPAAPRIPAP